MGELGIFLLSLTLMVDIRRSHEFGNNLWDVDIYDLLGIYYKRNVNLFKDDFEEHTLGTLYIMNKGIIMIVVILELSFLFYIQRCQRLNGKIVARAEDEVEHKGELCTFLLSLTPIVDIRRLYEFGNNL
ncbi:hypothetical protein C2G38_2177246 [Gigaspora rosea]|uniref:Uncharacterized protein n=1 Tax=Gigaspora rosea TaxID=44941 RepID=A0A397VIP2_9GLOM|nr:hypothetical protein C2G38_2177246 [Gigaspora rosea]